MKFDDIYDYVGHMGRFQWLIYAVIFLLNMFFMDFLNMIFVGGEMDHWCSVDKLSGLTHEQQRYVAIPLTSTSSDDVIVYSSCEMFDVNWTSFSVEELLSWNRTEWMEVMGRSNSSVSVRKCSGWNYDRTTFKSTIVSRYNLVCGREYLIEMAWTVTAFGGLAGTISSGFISDRFGRKIALVLSVVIKAIGSVIAIVSNSYELLVAGKLIASIGTMGGFIVALVLVMELSGPKRRTLVGAGMQLSWSLGFVCIPILAYFLRDEFTLMIATMGPTVIFIPFVMFTSALVYCALSMFSTQQNVSTSIYVSTLINGLVEIPVNAAAIWIIDWKPLGRKKTAIISLIGAGMTSFVGALSILYEHSAIAMTMSLLGKAFITLAYSAIYVHGTEIFPTEVRNVGVSSAALFECFGGIVAPLIGGMLKRTWLPLPSIIYGVCATISGLSYLSLPETLGLPLPDTIDQAEKMSADQKSRHKKKTKYNPSALISEDINKDDTKVILNGKQLNGEEVFTYSEPDKGKTSLRRNASQDSFESQK